MIAQWRLFLAALRFVIQPVIGFNEATKNSVRGDALDSDTLFPLGAARFVPLVGVLVGLIGAAAYWLAAQLWPTNVAVMLSLLASFAVTGQRSRLSALYWVFALLIEYNLLMSLSSAKVPYALPEFLPLGLILIAAQAVSWAMAVSVMATQGPVAQRASSVDLFVALVCGLAPAALLGIPGLIGLASAIGMRLLLGAFLLPRFTTGIRDQLQITQRATAISFYLGALAMWNYS